MEEIFSQFDSNAHAWFSFEDDCDFTFPELHTSYQSAVLPEVSVQRPVNYIHKTSEPGKLYPITRSLSDSANDFLKCESFSVFEDLPPDTLLEDLCASIGLGDHVLFDDTSGDESCASIADLDHCPDDLEGLLSDGPGSNSYTTPYTLSSNFSRRNENRPVTPPDPKNCYPCHQHTANSSSTSTPIPKPPFLFMDQSCISKLLEKEDDLPPLQINNRLDVVLSFLDLRSKVHTSVARWARILDESLLVTLPKTSFYGTNGTVFRKKRKLSGITDFVLDNVELANTVAALAKTSHQLKPDGEFFSRLTFSAEPSNILVVGEKVMCPFKFWTEDLHCVGHSREITMTGMLYGRFTADDKLCAIEMIFDAEDFKRQLLTLVTADVSHCSQSSNFEQYESFLRGHLFTGVPELEKKSPCKKNSRKKLKRATNKKVISTNLLPAPSPTHPWMSNPLFLQQMASTLAAMAQPYISSG